MTDKPKPSPASQTMVHIGTSPEAVAALRDVLLSILTVEKCGDEPKVAAVKALAKLGSVRNVQVQNCTFTYGKK